MKLSFFPFFFNFQFSEKFSNLCIFFLNQTLLYYFFLIFFENSLFFEFNFFRHKRNDNDAIRAYLAMALVYNDLENPREAQNLLEKRLEILERTGDSEEKVGIFLFFAKKNIKS